MGLKLEDDEYIECEFKAFAWLRWGPTLNGNWNRFILTNKRLIVKTRFFGPTSTLRWDMLESIELTNKGIVIKGSWKGKVLKIDASTKKVDDWTAEEFVRIANQHMRSAKKVE